MGDADIIPIGTRGRPGRGSGEEKPSASSRNLATGGRRPAARRPPGSPDPLASEREDHPAGTGRRSDQQHGDPQDPSDLADLQDAEGTVEEPAAATGRHETGGQHPLPGDLVGPAAGEAEVVALDLPERAPARTEHRLPTRGIPAIDWLGAFTSASKELFGASWEPRLAHFLAFLRRRLTGDFTVDEYGFDPEVAQSFMLAALRPIAEKWFRVEVSGLENLPETGGALVVSNHSGTVPIDGAVTAFCIHDKTGRFLRPLGADLVFKLPVLGDLARKGGATLACNADAERMLRNGELVGVWPEGFKGIGKPYSERYKLQRFGRGGFVSAAIRTGVPVIPTSVVGAEEIYPLVGNVPSLARLLGLPYLPITPLFPLLGPLGLVPLPSKWLIEFGEPIRTDSYDAGAADDPMLVFNVTDQVRETIQQTLYSLLMKRRSVFG